MPQAAVLLMDLQRDFLDTQRGRMPVDRPGAEAVLLAANEVMSRRVLPDALPVLIVNQFPKSDRMGNFFRKGAAVAGSAGAEIDDRVQGAKDAKAFAKGSPSAFSNPQLDNFLQANHVHTLYVLGVFAEGCVRSTVLDALKRGYRVVVDEDAVASNATWKKRFALWSMKRAGARVTRGLAAAGSPPSVEVAS